MKKIILMLGAGILLSLTACTDNTEQDGSVSTGDQHGTNDRMNNTSDSASGASATQTGQSGQPVGEDVRNPQTNTVPETGTGPGMDTTTRNPKNNGDTRRM